jgi:hypothetical protein
MVEIQVTPATTCLHGASPGKIAQFPDEPEQVRFPFRSVNIDNHNARSRARCNPDIQAGIFSE